MENQLYSSQPHLSSDLFTEEPIVFAGFWDRFGAAFLDGLILMVPNFVIQYIFTGFPVIDLLCTMLLGWLYSALQESGSKQATVGKKALGIKVTNLEGEQISFSQASGRHFGKYLSLIILCFGYFMMLWDDKRQTLHDKMAGTLVVKYKDS